MKVLILTIVEACLGRMMIFDESSDGNSPIISCLVGSDMSFLAKFQSTGSGRFYLGRMIHRGAIFHKDLVGVL